MDFELDFQRGFDRHVKMLGYVPAEFQNHGRVSDEYVWNTTPASMHRIAPSTVWQAMEDAAVLAHRTRNGNSDLAEAARQRGGYHGLGPEPFHIPDQRALIQGGDNDPLD